MPSTATETPQTEHAPPMTTQQLLAALNLSDTSKVSTLCHSNSGLVNTPLTSSKETALHVAVNDFAGENASMLKLLLAELGADVNAIDSDGLTAAHIAAGNGYDDSLRTLIKNGADVNMATQNEGYTPAHFAAPNGYAGCLRILHNAGADFTKAGQDGLTPMDLAINDEILSFMDALITNSPLPQSPGMSTSQVLVRTKAIMKSCGGHRALMIISLLLLLIGFVVSYALMPHHEVSIIQSDFS